MWERTLQDLIRGLRSHKTSSKAELDAFIDEALIEIRIELKGKDMELKAEGVMKMCYLMMLYPIPPPPSFAFYVVEVMSSPRYHLKQLGYIAAPMAFSSETEEVVLTVNGIRKDLLSPNPALPPLALAGLSDIMNASLAREVNQDVISLLSHSRPQVRKRAVLAIFKICEKYPDALHSGFARLRERLEDEDPGVVSATVNVICELSRRSNPKNYLPLAPQLFEILTTSSNNWMLIKVVKLFATLTPVEPRLVRKLLPPLTNLISTTPAISLLYECVRTCIVGGMLDQSEAGDALARVCVEKLSAFLSDEDQNLKYIALLAMVKIVPSHPHLIVDYQDEILESVDDADVSIRMRALELTSAMVNPHNVREIVTQLLSHLVPPTTTAATLPSAVSSLQKRSEGESSPVITSSPTSVTMSPAYRLEVVRRILQITSAGTYANITDFDWYMSVLIDLTYVSNVDVGEQIKDIILDVVARVRSVRASAVGLLARLLEDTSFLENLGKEDYCAEVIYAAAWVCGEYSSDLYDPNATISSLLQPGIRKLSPGTIAVCISAVTKIFGTWAARISENWSVNAHADAKAIVATAIDGLRFLAGGTELEVQERSANSLQLFRFVQADLEGHQPPGSSSDPDMPNGFRSEADDEPVYPKSLFLIKPLFSGYEMNPVGYRAQESVRVPDGLDLDAVLVPQPTIAEAEDEYDEGMLTSEDEGNLGEGGGKGMEELRRVLRETEGKAKKKRMKKGGVEETLEERLARKAARRAKRKGDPYYLETKDELDIDSIPIVKLELDDEPLASALRSSSKRSKAMSPLPQPPQIDRNGEMPEGSIAPSEDNRSAKGKQKATNRNADEDGLKGIDLTSSTNNPPPPPSRGRYEEYKMDDEVRTGPPDQPAEQSAKIEVVKVKKKKKKPAPIVG